MQELDSAQQDLDSQVRELKSQNGLLKAELCRKDGTYSWCGS